VSARIKFTGRKPDFKKEMSIGFGDYCECYDPKATSNDAGQARSEPCIALYPTGNSCGSWCFLNIATKKRVRRTNWTKMVTSDLILRIMNEFSKSEEDAAPVAEQEEENVVTIPPQLTEKVANRGESLEDATAVEDTAESTDVSHEDVQVEEVEPLKLPEPRRSARIAGGKVRTRPVTYKAFHTSVRKGIEEHGHEAYKAIVAELRQLLQEKKALEPVLRQDLSARQVKNIIRSLMFMKTKFDGLGRFEKIKARLVANGKQQDRTLYPDTYSPTVALQSVMMCLTVAAKERRKLCAIDIGGAYLNAERVCEEGDEVIMELEPMLVGILKKMAPEVKPYVDAKGRMLVKLNKAMYGTLDAAKIWYEKLTGVLTQMGFSPNSVDQCVYNKIIDGKQCTIMVYVDDLLVTCASQSGIDKVIEDLKAHFEGDVKSSSDKDLSYLGMHLKIEDGRI
jgi:hypothetical protein